MFRGSADRIDLQRAGVIRLWADGTGNRVDLAVPGVRAERRRVDLFGEAITEDDTQERVFAQLDKTVNRPAVASRSMVSSASSMDVPTTLITQHAGPVIRWTSRISGHECVVSTSSRTLRTGVWRTRDSGIRSRMLV